MRKFIDWWAEALIAIIVGALVGTIVAMGLDLASIARSLETIASNCGG